MVSFSDANFWLNPIIFKFTWFLVIHLCVLNDKWWHFTISRCGKSINQPTNIKSLIYSKSVPSVVEDTSINYSTYLLIHLTKETIYAKYSNIWQNMTHHKWIVLYAIEFHRENPSDEGINVGKSGDETQIFAICLSLRIKLCFFFWTCI